MHVVPFLLAETMDELIVYSCKLRENVGKLVGTAAHWKTVRAAVIFGNS